MIDVERWLTVGGLAVLAAVVFAERELPLGFFLPGDTLLFIAGFLASAAVDVTSLRCRSPRWSPSPPLPVPGGARATQVALASRWFASSRRSERADRST